MGGSTRKQDDGAIRYWSAVSIGVGGMVGGGIFAVLGLAVELAHGGTPIAFLIAGVVALLTAYSYVKLSLSFPSQGGTVVFLDRAFGVDLFTGTMNNLLWLSYVVMLSLYAHAFGSYGASFFSEDARPVAMHVILSLAVLVPAVLNFIGAKIVGRAETWVVAIKVAILSFFVIVGIGGIDPERLQVSSWTPMIRIVSGGMIIFLSYEGFELIANAAEDVSDRKRTLPKAFYTAVVFVIVLYVLVAIVAVGNLPVDRIVEAKDYALAAAARPFLGQTGFTLIAIAALLSTFSAINATMYGAARLSYTIAKEGELPPFLEDKVWNKPVEGLIITTILTLLVANLADLTSISTMGSAGFLLVFGAVNVANVRLAERTGSARWISAVAAVACLASLVALIVETAATAAAHLFILVGLVAISFLIEAVWSMAKKRGYRLQ